MDNGLYMTLLIDFLGGGGSGKSYVILTLISLITVEVGINVEGVQKLQNK